MIKCVVKLGIWLLWDVQWILTELYRT